MNSEQVPYISLDEFLASDNEEIKTTTNNQGKSSFRSRYLNLLYIRTQVLFYTLEAYFMLYTVPKHLIKQIQYNRLA